jgi:hypothetical protein
MAGYILNKIAAGAVICSLGAVGYALLQKSELDFTLET